jgi:colicin import membrane protein
MHLVLLALLIVGLDWTPKVTAPGSNVPIQAELVTEDPLKQIEQRKQADAQRKAEQQAREKAAAEVKKQAEAKQKTEQQAQQKAAAEAKQKAETAAKQKAAVAAKQKAEQQAQEKAAAEAKQKAAAEAKQKAAAAAKQKAEAEAAARRKAESDLQAQLATEQQQARAQSALSQYIPYIQDKVNRNWIRPPGSPEGLVCVVKVRLIPGGEVVGASVIQSSGDPVFDRSVESAVLKASPLPLPTDPELFNHFREINFKFNPGR